ncbi:MAG: hypothetical protein WC303_01955 [Candidatus Paceibacterota bacterium]|jgi:hypothetical protein
MKAINQKYLFILFVLALIFIGGFLFFSNKKEKAPVINNPNNGIITPKLIDTSSWTNYANAQLGFSIIIPLEINGKVRCSDMQATNVPVKVFADNSNGLVYISQAYYYDAWDQAQQKMTDQCKKITPTLDSLRDGYILGWKIVINDIKNDEDILKYVKENFGPTCSITDRGLQKDGNYQISIKGRDLTENGEVTMDPTCLTNFVYKILYSQEKQKLMSVALGQECSFGTDPSVQSSYQCYDNTMIQSFKFQ